MNRQQVTSSASLGSGGRNATDPVHYPWAAFWDLHLIQCNACKRFCLMTVSPELSGSIQKHQT